MDDLISRQALLDAFGLSEKTRKYGGDHSGYDTLMLYEIQDVIEGMPSVEPKTGEWIHDGSHWANRWICDKCGYKLFGVKTKFCPDCGQRMEVDNERND